MADKTGEAAFLIGGVRVPAEPIEPGLHVVATPIGNLADISLRALRTLAAADAVLAEDTRVTRVLLGHYGIGTPLVAYHEHNAAAMRPQLLGRLQAGAALALVSDAGTPLVSDPGYKLAAEAGRAGLPVTAVPGASAVLAALTVGGLPTDRFFFEGFLPARGSARRERIAALAAVLGARPAAVARELTKRFETVRRGSLPDLRDAFAGEPPRGEIVVLVGPPDDHAPPPPPAALDARLGQALGHLSVKDAASVVAAETGLPRREVYARAVALAAARGGQRDD